MKLMGRILGAKIKAAGTGGAEITITEISGTPEYSDNLDISYTVSKIDLQEMGVISKVGAELKFETYDFTVMDSLKKGMLVASAEVTTAGAAISNGTAGLTYAAGGYKAYITGGRITELQPNHSDGKHTVKITVKSEKIEGVASEFGYVANTQGA